MTKRSAFVTSISRSLALSRARALFLSLSLYDDEDVCALVVCVCVSVSVFVCCMMPKRSVLLLHLQCEGEGYVACASMQI